MMKTYNIDKASPLSGTYERGPEVLGKGEVGIWFLGNWAWPQISSVDTAAEQYGFLPGADQQQPRRLRQYANIRCRFQTHCCG